MKKLNFVIADRDESFALQVQKRLEDKLGAAAETVVITDKDFLLRYFETPHKIDALLIDKAVYFQAIEKHDIGLICIVTESPDECSAAGGFISYVYRFAGLGDIASKMMSDINPDFYSDGGLNSGCKTVVVASPVGGCGKTVAALGICAAINKSGKKVLFVDTSSLQSSSFWLNSKKKNKSDVELMDCLTSGQYRDMIETRSFDCLAPFAQPLPALGLSAGSYIEPIAAIKSDLDYDYIVVDTGSDFSVEISQLIATADKVILVTMQDAVSVGKLSKYFASTDCSDIDKYCLFCNLFRPERKSSLDKLTGTLPLSGYIPFADVSSETDLKQIGNMQCFRRIAAILG